MNNISINHFTENKKPVKLIQTLGKAGGEGQVFLSEDQFAVKVFNEKVDIHTKNKKIDILLNKHISEASFCLPIQKIFSGDGKLTGFTMKLAKGETIQSCVFNRKGLLSKFPHWNRINLSNLAVNLLSKIKILHDNNIIIGDINPHNIMINSDSEIYFIDTDSFQLEGLPGGVGSDLFNSPELRGANFRKVLRTKESEYFSIATLLFMIFLPGKNPWEYIGGNDLTANIKDQNFSYPMGEDDNLQAPRGIWEFIWLELSYDLRKTFYDVFKNHRRFNLDELILVIEAYKHELIINRCTKDIFPSQIDTTIAKYKSLNLNKGTNPEFKKNLRIEKTELSLDQNNKKIAVIELSTTAVKLLLADQDKIKSGEFDFNHFKRDLSTRTDTGSLLDSDNVMDVEGFVDTVIPAIKNYVDFASKSNVKDLYGVATAAYRTAYNRNQIIDLVRLNCHINIKILTKKEEASATLNAFAFSKPSNINYEKDKNYMFIDQGGGSTEITIFKGQNIVETYSVNLGSTSLKNIFFKEATTNTTFEKAFRDSEELIKEKMKVYFKNYSPRNLGSFCVSVGNSIIQATGGKTAFTKHGVCLTTSDIKNKIRHFETVIRENYNSISHLHDSSMENKFQQLRVEKRSDQVDNILNSRLALPMYIQIMERFNIKEVIVSNTGLIYGIFLEKLLQK